jgi:hypothetical protein
MTFLKNTISLLAIFSIIPTAHAAAAARPSIMNAFNTASAASRRMPSARTSPVTPVANNTTSSTGILDEIECIDAYTECIASDDTCGSDFEECTTNVLFHAQMPKCTSTLLQCTSAGISRLFGTTDVASLSNVDSYVADTDDTEVARYTFPSDGSVMGQRIIAGAIANTYDTQSCVKNYMRCLNKDDVCGADFELCTTNADFKKQSFACESTLARCQTAGHKELFGEKGLTNKFKADAESRIGEAITNGAELAALNAVTTCYKTVDSCFVNACKLSPLSCIAGVPGEQQGAGMTISRAINVGNPKLEAVDKEYLKRLKKVGSLVAQSVTAETVPSAPSTASDVNSFLRANCETTIGSNEYCYMTFKESKPKAKDLKDADVIDEIFSEALDARKSGLTAKFEQMAQEFDKTAKDACINTLGSCVSMACGDGSGPACYDKVFNSTTNTNKSINNTDEYDAIKNACAGIINIDQNCIYAASAQADVNSDYTYAYVANDTFTTIFPQYNSAKPKDDPIGAIAYLNGELAKKYNKQTIENMKKQCQAVAERCVRNECGSDFVNCYRNRTDIYSDITAVTGSSSNGVTADMLKPYQDSMNKVGGVLDYTIIAGLCIDTIKDSPICEDHLSIEKAKYKTKDGLSDDSSWKNDYSSVRKGWFDQVGSASNVDKYTPDIQETDADGNNLCYATNGKTGICGDYAYDANDAKVYSEYYDPNSPVMTSYSTYTMNLASESLFREVIFDLEKEAQAKYNAKLTKQQNMCLAANAGGIMGGNDMSSIYKWVKLSKNGSRVPNDYSVQGLTTGQFKASNDLYGSFCAVRVTLQSDDPDIMAALSGNYNGQTFKRLGTGNHELRADTNLDVDLSTSASRYFAIGDPITCGSWLSYADLEKIAQVVEAKAKSAKEKTQNTSLRTWMPILGAVGLGTGGVFLGDAIQKGNVLNNLSGIASNKKAQKNPEKDTKNCKSYLDKAYRAVSETCTTSPSVSFVNDVATACKIVQKYNSSLDCLTSSIESKIAYNAWYAEVVKGDSCNATTVTTATTATKKAINSLVNDWCDSIDGDGTDNTYAGGETWWKNHGGQFLGGVISAGVGAGLTYAITDSVLNAELDKAGQEAYQAFMDNIGSKIHCYIGSQEVATYGQVIETSME